MASYENFYAGADTGLDPNYGSFTGYRVRPEDLGYAVDAKTANQLQKTSQTLNTGAKTIEVSGINIVGGGGPSKVLDAIPKQHFKEINRLKKLSGVDLTFHGPLVEPTGVRGQNWSELDREHVETEVTNALDRAHDLDPDGNIIVTFHSSVGLPEPETITIDDDGKKITRNISVVSEGAGRVGQLPAPTPDYFTGKEVIPVENLKEINKRNWVTNLSNINIGLQRAEQSLMEGINIESEDDLKKILPYFKEVEKNPDLMGQTTKKFSEDTGIPEFAFSRMISHINHAQANARDSYLGLQQEFNNAYEALKDSDSEKDKLDLRKLNNFRDEMSNNLNNWSKNPEKLKSFTEGVSKGVRILNSINPPQILKPIREFAIDKASDTFSGAAIKGFKKFKETAPIISIENPPAGDGLSKGEEMRDLVKESRRKFAKRAQAELGMSKEESEKQAEKLIGVTWDVGHINMLRKYGYKDKDLVKETEKVAPFTKHIHLSDNFGLEHTELPMGMGNVPTKKHLALIEKYNKQAKKIVEAGDWRQHFGDRLPVLESAEAMGMPLYSSGGAPYWNQAKTTFGNYSSGLGPINPDVHHSLYGGGYSNLPVDLGGQMEGQNRLSGTQTQ